MTDLELRTEATSLEQVPAPTSISEWANEARDAARLAVSLAKTNFVPASLRGKPEDIAAAILTGYELGMPPMTALRSIDLVKGVPTLRAHAMRALLQSHGHEIELVEASPTSVTMRGRRKGATEWQTVVWTMARAQQMGLASQDNYKRMGQQMLTARATGELSRLIAADALHGVAYTTEEMQSYEPVKATVEQHKPVTAAEILGTPPAREPVETEVVDTEWPEPALIPDEVS